MDPIRKIPKKVTKKLVNKVTNWQYFHRKTGLKRAEKRNTWLYSDTCFTKPISEFAHFGKNDHKTKAKIASLIYKIVLKEILLKRNSTLNIKISISRPSKSTEKFANVVKYNDKVYVVCKVLLQIKSCNGLFLSAMSLRRTSKDLNSCPSFLPSFLLHWDKILTKTKSISL